MSPPSGLVVTRRERLYLGGAVGVAVGVTARATAWGAGPSPGTQVPTGQGADEPGRIS